MFVRECRLEDLARVSGGPAGVVFDLGRQVQLSERDGALLPVLLARRVALDDQRIQVGPGGVDGGRPPGRAASDYDDVFDGAGHVSFSRPLSLDRKSL